MSSVSSTDGGYQYYQRPLSDLEDDLRNDAKRSREHDQERIQKMQEAQEQELRDRDEQIDQTTRTIRENSSDRVRKEREVARKDVEQARAQAYDRFGRTGSEDSGAKQKYEQAIVEVQNDFDHRLKGVERAKEEQGKSIAEEANAKVEKAITEQRDAHAVETKDLREKVGTLNEWADSRKLEGNRKAEEFVKGYENEYRSRAINQQNAHEQEIGKMHRELAETEDNLSRGKNQALLAQSDRYGNLMRKQTQENQNTINNLQSNYQRDREQLETSAKMSLASQAKANEQKTEASQRHTEEMMKKQSEAFNQSQGQTKQANLSRINELENKLQVKETTDDPNEVSPRADAAIRRSVGGQYEKLFNEEKGLHERRQAELKNQLKTETDDLRNENRMKEMHLTNQNALQSHQDLSLYRQYLDDAQHEKNETIRSNIISRDRQLELQTKLNAREAEGQRRQYEELFETIKTESSDRMQGTKEDLGFKLKMSQREFALRYGEQGRAYERKLQEQKDQYELMLDNQKTDLDKTIKDLEHRNRTTIEQQDRASSQKMTQMEQQYKERERKLAESYEGELDKMRRANALLMQKKS